PVEWGKARDAILHAFWQTLAPQGTPRLEELSLPTVNWLAGLTSAADWIASNPEWFPLGERHDDLRAYYAHARELAAAALNHIGCSRAQSLLHGPAELNALLSWITQREGMQARPLQQT